MKIRLSNISILQTAKIAGILYAAFGLFFVPFGCALLAMGNSEPAYPYLATFYICSPLVYAVIGFVTTALMVWLYNLIAKQIGGVEFTLDQVAS